MARWRSRDLLLGLLVLSTAATAAVAVSVLGIPVAPCASVSREVVTFTITADLNGYNGSKIRGGQGPFLSVHTCDTVVMRLANRDVQAHGLAVDFYAANGLEALHGDVVKMQFLAYKTGDFRIFCNTLCSVHSYMQNAKLTVQCSMGQGCV